MFDAKSLLNSLLGSQTAASVNTTASSVAAQGQDALGQVGSFVASALSKAEAQTQGTQVGDLLGTAQKTVSANTAATGAAVAGLAALLLGTGTGRSALGDAAKVGGLAALGGLAYKAFSNYQSGKPLMAGVPFLDQAPTVPGSAVPGSPAPIGSGFHADDHSHDNALVMIRAAVATAAADGVVDPAQRAKILAEMQTAGLDAEAAKFLDAAIAHPASVADIAAAAGGSPQLAVQAYAASRIIASPASPREQSFLASLAQALKLDPALVAQVDAAVAHA